MRLQSIDHQTSHCTGDCAHLPEATLPSDPETAGAEKKHSVTEARSSAPEPHASVKMSPTGQIREQREERKSQHSIETNVEQSS